MSLYIVGIAIEPRGKFVDATFTLQFDSKSPQVRSMLEWELINAPQFFMVTNTGEDCVQGTVTLRTKKQLREAVDILVAVESAVLSRLNELTELEKTLKSCAGYYVKQVAESSMWDKEEDINATD